MMQRHPLVRVHSALLLLHPCSKLWYLCRALDPEGRGYVVLDQQRLLLLGESRSTIYRWLAEGKELGFFVKANFRGNSLHASLGGLLRVCKKNNIRHWGATALIPLEEILSGNGRRTTASLITIQAFQSSSQYAAKHQLKTTDRAKHPIVSVPELLNFQTSQKLERGGTPGILHVTDTKIWVSRYFIPFGVSQERASGELNSHKHSCGVSVRTLRRHVDSSAVPHKQVIQGKGEYTEIGNAIANGATSHKAKGSQDIIFHWSAKEPEKIVLRESQGTSKARRDEGHTILPKQLFRYLGGRYWLNRCNVYDLSFELKSMRFTRKKLKDFFVNSPPAPPNIDINISPPTTPLRAVGGDENKEDKNENFSNPCPTSDTAYVEKSRFTELLRQMKEKQQNNQWK